MKDSKLFRQPEPRSILPNNLKSLPFIVSTDKAYIFSYVIRKRDPRLIWICEYVVHTIFKIKCDLNTLDHEILKPLTNSCVHHEILSHRVLIRFLYDNAVKAIAFKKRAFILSKGLLKSKTA